jgi:hypothetical protein
MLQVIANFISHACTILICSQAMKQPYEVTSRV